MKICNVEGSAFHLNEKLSGDLVGTDENHEKEKTQDCQCPGQDPNWPPLEYEARLEAQITRN
jgi:hypothetical protein